LLMLDRRPTRRASLSALAIGAAIMSGLELAQVLIWTRYADATDVIVGWTGVAAGVFLAPRILPQALEDQPSRTGINWSAAAAALCWACVLAAFEWNPFEFVRDPGVVRANLTRFLEVPFTGFYGSDPMAALGDAVSKVLLAAPLGLFTEFMFRPGAARLGPRLRALLSFAPFLVFFCGLELGQAFIAGRYPSITDAVILTTAAAGGCLVAATGRGLGRAQHDATDVGSVSYSRRMGAPALVKVSESQAEETSS